jgi:16S rRNA (uracil1498-N3)-methyltransferase
MGRDPGAPPLAAHPPRFLVTTAVAVGECVRLDAAETKHARVRRLRAGEAIAVFDGRGGSYLGVVERAGGTHLDVRVTQRLRDRAAESPCALTLAIAQLKADRLEWAIEKATELGVARVRPFVSQWSLARPSPARRTRWQHVALAAAKQSGRSIVPEIDAPTTLHDVLSGEGVRLFCWEGAASDAEPARIAAPRALTIIVGPEGGFTPAEVDAARGAGCMIISLGPRVLRGETAAVAAIALCQSWWGDILAPPGTTP